MNPIENFIYFYQHFSQDSVAQLSTVYTDDITFVDPVATHHGLPALTRYFSNLLGNTQRCDFCLTEIKQLQDSAYISWQMNFRHAKLNAGELIQVEGISQVMIRNNKIMFQRDYYDLGNMLYEHVPVIGALIRYLKRKLLG